MVQSCTWAAHHQEIAVLAENPQDKLKQAIAAAQRGEKTIARRLLQQVLSEDRDSEMAWIWMASVVESNDERRACLERVLKINPNNARAKEALKRMGVNLSTQRGDGADLPSPVSAVAAATSAAAEAIRGGGNRTLYFAIATAVSILLLGLFLVSIFASGPSDASVRETAVAFAITQRPTDIPPTVDPDDYTATPFFGIVVTLAPDELTPLPPTFTPTATMTATVAPPATATPVPVSSFPFVFSARVGDEGAFALLQANADGSDVRPVAQDFGESFAVSPGGDRIAIVRLVSASADFVQPTPAEGQEAPPPINLIPQLFVGSLADPAAAQQITQMVGSTMSRPAWTSNGQSIIFSSNQDGDSELYIIDAAGGAPSPLTDNEANDSDPAVSPDGQVVVFASDLETPGSQELFALLLASGEIRQLTNASGSSTSPSFSPDGLRIAFVSDRVGDGDIWIIDASGQRAFLVTIDDGDAEDRSPAWTPDGRWIMFASNRGGETFQAYLISPDGGTLLPVTSGTDNVQSIGFLPALP
jgi:hypothetical protein